MPQLPVISGKVFLKFLQNIGFVIVRINGSHHQAKTSGWPGLCDHCSCIALHKSQDTPAGLICQKACYEK